MRNQYKVLAEKYSLVVENNNIITSIDQYNEKGMKYITSLLLKRYKGKVKKEILDWIRDNFSRVFIFAGLRGTIDKRFKDVVMVRWENEGTDDYSDEALHRNENEVLDILVNRLSRHMLKRASDEAGIEMDI